MRIVLIGLACSALAVSPSFAQTPVAAPAKQEDKSPDAGSRAPLLPATPQPPVTNPAEISSGAMVEEQEKRDREEQAERDRDDR